MASSPPESPSGLPQRPMSAMMKPPRSSSRMSMTSKAGGGSRASDEDGKTSVKVGMTYNPLPERFDSMLTILFKQLSVFAHLSNQQIRVTSSFPKDFSALWSRSHHLPVWPLMLPKDGSFSCSIESSLKTLIKRVSGSTWLKVSVHLFRVTTYRCWPMASRVLESRIQWVHQVLLNRVTWK